MADSALAIEMWNTIKLGDALEKIMGGGTPSKSESKYWNGNIPWASVKDMSDGVYRLSSTVDHITELGLQNSATNLIPKGIIIISTRMGLGRCFRADKDITINQDLKALFPNELINSDFLLWLMVFLGPKIESMGTGTTVKGIRLEQLRNLDINLPPLLTQHKIAAILSSYDDLIENNTRRIQILEEMAHALYREWFVEFRFPGHEKVKMVESELGMIPEGWEVKRLVDVCDIVMGQSPKSEFYNEIGEGLPFHQGVTNFGDRFPTDRMYCTVEKRIAEGEDILFSVRAPVGRINIADKKIVIGRGLCAIRSKSGNQAFVFQQLKDIFKEEDSIGGGTIFKSVTKDDMHVVKFIVPSDTLFKDFEDIIAPIFVEIKNMTMKNRNLRHTRDLLLPKLISGQLNVENMD